MAETPTLLLAEDDPNIRPLVAELLTDEDYEVIQEENGSEAIRVLREHQLLVDGICLVVLDMVMPKANGLDVLRELAELGHYVPVVAMSADWQQLRRAKEAGADDTLRKPFDLERLLTVVERNCTG